MKTTMWISLVMLVVLTMALAGNGVAACHDEPDVVIIRGRQHLACWATNEFAPETDVVVIRARNYLASPAAAASADALGADVVAVRYRQHLAYYWAANEPAVKTDVVVVRGGQHR